VLALFDLDGTVSAHDTLPRYLLGFLARHRRRLSQVAAGLPALGRFALRRADHGQLKAAWIGALMGGSTRAQVDTWTAHFVPPLVRSGLFADALSAIGRHRDAGDTLVLLSASPNLYVPAIGAALGFTEVLSTAIAWRDDELDGALVGPNLRGAEKARCLIELRRRHGLPVIAYANAASDLEHLALADQGVLVNGSHAARAAAARLGVTMRSWR
jgi:phosphatidylglycerophosphatase C